MKRHAPSRTAWPDCVDEARQIYNRPVRKQGIVDGRGFDPAAEMVADKLKEFCRCFSQRAQVQDLLSKKVLLTDASQVRTRYQTVFRESGEELQVRCARLNKRMLSSSKSLTPLPPFCPSADGRPLSRRLLSA